MGGGEKNKRENKPNKIENQESEGLLLRRRGGEGRGIGRKRGKGREKEVHYKSNINTYYA